MEYIIIIRQFLESYPTNYKVCRNIDYSLFNLEPHLVPDGTPCMFPVFDKGKNERKKGGKNESICSSNPSPCLQFFTDINKTCKYTTCLEKA